MNNTSPIERLNYFNGQRLEAADFRLEQDFHMRVRRVLNKSLYTPGIAAGLEVEKVLPEPSHSVRILPGLALDSLGREIILIEPIEVPVAGKPTEPTEPVSGNYLVIEYAEEATAFAGDGCAVQLGVTCKATEDLAWGAPSRIRAEPKLYIQHQWPKPAENKIVLAQLELNPDCSVREIRTFVRKYVAASKPATVLAFAFEGEKDIDKDNKTFIYFRVTGGVPNRATLILRGEKFSTLFYTELGNHAHTLSATVSEVSQDLSHTHTVKGGTTTPAGKHTHGVWIDDGVNAPGVDVDTGDDWNFKVLTEEGEHTHDVKDITMDTALGVVKHSHTVNVGGSGAGVSDISARSGAGVVAYEFLDDLRVGFDGKDITPVLIKQLVERDGANVWTKLGDGTNTHKLSSAEASGKVEGTGEIDLLRLDGVDLAPGDHWITLSVPAGGGKIQYNLYIE